jgi:FkbM family methyltransferase
VNTKKLIFTLNAHHCVLEFPDEPLCEFVTTEVLTGKSYPIFTWFPPVKSIVDLGASFGPFSIRMAATFSGAMIHAYEPNPAAFAYLERNTAGLPIACHEVAVTDLATSEHPWIILHQHKIPLMTSLVPSAEKDALRHTQEINVPAIHPRQLPSQIDILKIDIEGREPQVLQAIHDRIPQIKVIYVEFHSPLDRLAIDQLLTPTHWLYHGRIQMHNNGELTYVNKELLLG